ncbi:putative metacaspase [Boletus reticuloceps]|uniref:Putative metacaspase n=1 Tax=Boletus reticuloceps TaxID=495285 RepID=A0A8I3A7W2_9AGAM|nr:putative metacaspase [Boletus reticuloceps]
MFIDASISGYATGATPPGPFTQYAPPPYPSAGHAPPKGYPHSGTYAPPPGPPGGHTRYLPPPGPPGYQAPPGPPMPPTGQQTYQHQPVPGGQMQPAYFQYSQCNGKKKALLIGINYFGQPEALNGCIEDARRMKKFLSGHGYREEDMVMLTDDASHPRQQPTRQNMIDAMQWLVRNAQPNDSLFFHYSGHGGQTKDLDGDEDDGYDEVIYPVDFKRTSHIVDDEMHMIMVRGLPTGCRLTAIFDACHSGSALGTNPIYFYSTEGKLKEPNVKLGAAKGLFSTLVSFETRDMGGMIQGVTDLLDVASGRAQKAHEYTKATRTCAADVMSWSGCKDNQTSADAQIRGRSTGAMSDAVFDSTWQVAVPD